MMKKKTGLVDSDPGNGDLLNVDEAFKLLRPDSPYKLSEMLNPNFNPKNKLDLVLKRGKSLSKELKKAINKNSPSEVCSICIYNTNGWKSASNIGSCKGKISLFRPESKKVQRKIPIATKNNNSFQ